MRAGAFSFAWAFFSCTQRAAWLGEDGWLTTARKNLQGTGKPQPTDPPTNLKKKKDIDKRDPKLEAHVGTQTCFWLPTR